MAEALLQCPEPLPENSPTAPKSLNDSDSSPRKIAGLIHKPGDKAAGQVIIFLLICIRIKLFVFQLCHDIIRTYYFLQQDYTDTFLQHKTLIVDRENICYVDSPLGCLEEK